MLDTITLQTTLSDSTVIVALYTLLVSFILSAMIAVAYIKTFKGLSFSQGYVQALMLGAMVAATVMQAIGDSLAHGLGILGALAIIRFRTSFKDARDIIFMFASLASGIACGVQGYTIAVIGTLGFILVAIGLHFSYLGRASYFDGLLRFNIENRDDSKRQLEVVFREYCQSYALITLREVRQGERLDYAYQVKLKKNKTSEQLLEKLRKEIVSLESVAFLMQEATTEI